MFVSYFKFVMIFQYGLVACGVYIMYMFEKNIFTFGDTKIKSILFLVITLCLILFFPLVLIPFSIEVVKGFLAYTVLAVLKNFS